MNFENQLNNLMTKAQLAIVELINEHGSESKHIDDYCLQVKDTDLMFDLEGSRYLTEVHADKLLDNKGYRYSHHALTMERFVQVVDYLIETYSSDKQN